jgi:hypothetical protein
MTLLESISHIAPNTTNSFISWLMYEYGISFSEFDLKPLNIKFAEVKRYFGYSITEEPDLSNEAIIARIKEIFTDYEILLVRYPSGMKDPLGKYKEMNYRQRAEAHKEFEKRIINICLHHAVISGYSLVRPSLHDSITERIMSQAERALMYEYQNKKATDTFFQDIVKSFRQDEIAPF